MTDFNPHSSKAAATFSMDDFLSALEEHDFPFQKGQVVMGRVVEHDSNGAYVDIKAKSPAFLPLKEIPAPSIEDLPEILPLGSEEEFLIVRDQNSDGQMTVSRRQLQIKRVWQQLAQMQTNNESLTVRVSQTNKGGVLVNVQGLRGFVPRSHLMQREDLESLVGQQITVGLLQVDPAANKLVLSQKLVTQTENMEQFQEGQLVEGEISGIKPFGVFVQVGGVTGLLHIKQISQKYISSLSDLFTIGQPIKAVIVQIDGMKGRMSLSTRVLEKYPGEVVEEMETVMAQASDRVNKLQGKLLQEA